MPTRAVTNLLAGGQMQSLSLSKDVDRSHLQFSDILVRNASRLCGVHCIFDLLGSLGLLLHASLKVHLPPCHLRGLPHVLRHELLGHSL